MFARSFVDGRLVQEKTVSWSIAHHKQHRSVHVYLQIFLSSCAIPRAFICSCMARESDENALSVVVFSKRKKKIEFMFFLIGFGSEFNGV